MAGLMLWVCCTAGKHRSPYAISLLSAALQQIHPELEIKLFLPSYNKTSSTAEVYGAAGWLQCDPRWAKKCCDQGVYKMPELTQSLEGVAAEFLDAASGRIKQLQICVVKEEVEQVAEQEEELKQEEEEIKQEEEPPRDDRWDWRQEPWSEPWSEPHWQPTAAARDRSRSPKPSG